METDSSKSSIFVLFLLSIVVVIVCIIMAWDYSLLTGLLVLLISLFYIVSALKYFVGRKTTESYVEEEIDVDNEDDIETDSINEKLSDNTNLFDVGEKTREIKPVLREHAYESIEDKVKKKVEAKQVAKLQFMNHDWVLPKISLLERTEEIEETEEEPVSNVAERVSQFLNNNNVPNKLLNCITQNTFNKIVLALDRKKNLEETLKIQKILCDFLGADNVYVQPLFDANNVVEILLPKKDGKIFLHSLIDEAKEHSLEFVVGEDYNGSSVIGDLKKCRSLLISGNQISGKTSMIHTILDSLLMKNTPNDFRLAIIDSKRLNYETYTDIPHLIAPIIHDNIDGCEDFFKVFETIRGNRVNKMHDCGVKNLDAYNKKASIDNTLTPMPHIVIVVDELDYYMNNCSNNLQLVISNILSTAEITGMHLIATSLGLDRRTIPMKLRTGFNGRISFATATEEQSSINLEESGAESLSRHGEVMFMETIIGKPIRTIVPYYQSEDTYSICSFLKTTGQPLYDDAFVIGEDEVLMMLGQTSADPLYEDVKKFVATTGKASTSHIQRYFGFGYNRAARIIDFLEQEGAIGPANGSEPREVYITADDFK